MYCPEYPKIQDMIKEADDIRKFALKRMVFAITKEWLEED